MNKRRLLSDRAYDFFVHDCRDGEDWGPYDTRAEAGRKQAEIRSTMEPWRRSVIEVQWQLNERKILRLYGVTK